MVKSGERGEVGNTMNDARIMKHHYVVLDSAQILPTHIMKIEVDPNACSTVEKYDTTFCSVLFSSVVILFFSSILPSLIGIFSPHFVSLFPSCYQCQKKPSVYYCEADAAYLCGNSACVCVCIHSSSSSSL